MNKTFTEYEPMKNIVSTTSTTSLGQIEITVPLEDNKEDLIWFLRACKQEELYEYCRFLKDIIDNE